MAQPKIITLFLLLSIGLLQSITAQTHHIKYLSAYQSAMGSNTSVVQGAKGITGNPAGLFQPTEDFSIMVSTEQRYFLGSLNSTSLAGLKSLSDLDCIAIGISNFGIDEFQERRYTLGYSRLLSENLVIGATANYYQFQIEEYDNQNDLDINLGFIALISKNMTLGVHLANILPDASRDYLREDIEISAGLNYELSNDLNWLLELKSDTKDYVYFSTGIQYAILDDIHFMIGFNTWDKGLSVGLSYNFNKNLSLIGSNRSTQNLGNSPSLSLEYSRYR